jgi:polysaccharide biosynthesis protein PelA
MSQSIKKVKNKAKNKESVAHLGLLTLIQKGIIATYVFSILCFFFAGIFAARVFAGSTTQAPPSSNELDQEDQIQTNSQNVEVKDNANLVPRTILSLYFNEKEIELTYHPIHRFIDMPLHHLGLRVKHWNLKDGFPPEEKMQNVRGILAYFDTNQISNPLDFLSWSIAQIESGKKFVLLGDLGFYENMKKERTPVRLINNFLAHLGLRMSKETKEFTYDINYQPYDANRIEFERSLSKDLNPFISINALSPNLDIILSTKESDEATLSSILVSLHDKGGYAARGYYLFTNKIGNVQWRINPFNYFKKAFATENLPKLDTTTDYGRRIYYSHIDGDGWRSISQVPGYKEQNKNCAQVVLKEIIQKYPQLPLTVSPIAADLDIEYFGTKELQKQAKEIFTYNNVEIGSHTYTHPLYWKFYDDKNPAEKEKKLFGDSKNKLEFEHNREKTVNKVGDGYSLPRSYLFGKFDLEKELTGSVKFIQGLAPEGKKVSLYQWSGDCMPFEKAINILRQQKIHNLNGGDSRFDSEFPSYAFVSPIGRDDGDEWQIYSSNNNENTYTDGWTKRFFGFKYLVNTFNLTGTPLRLKPLNIYFHMYSAEKISSLRALLDNFAYVLQQEIIPITAKNYAAIGDGFFEGDLTQLGDQTWQVKNRGALNTIRFDEASLKEVNWEKSNGVIGQNYAQGSLYVALDKRNLAPIIALKERDSIAARPAASSKPYLISSRWRIWNVDFKENGLTFIAQGYGPGDMSFYCPLPGTYQIQGHTKDTRLFSYNGKTDKDGILKISVKESGVEPISLILTPEANKETISQQENR